MPKFDVSRSITIDAPAADVFAILNDFNQWHIWSPWLITEPEATIDIAPDGESYSWHGNRVGEGTLTRISATAPTEISCDLTFLKPWKSQALTEFKLEPQGRSVKVTWKMYSSLPFFMFFMKKMMIALIGMDYDRGLAMLKDYAETGTVPSKIEFTGTTQFEGCRYLGITTDCAISEVGPAMEADMKRLQQHIKSGQTDEARHPFSIYHKWDMVKGKTQYTLGIPIKELPAQIPTGFTTGEIPPVETYCITHHGPYRHLGNAWSTGMGLARSKAFKQNKQIHPFETYPKQPGEVNEKDVETRVYFPIHS